MRWQVWFYSIAGLLLSVSAANATAYSADQRDCLQSEPDRRIAACTRVIGSTPKVHNRMVAHDNRGKAWENKRDYDRALADYTAAIQHGAGDASVYMIYNSRGLIWKYKGDFDRAIADFNQAIRLNPKYPMPISIAERSGGNGVISTGRSRTKARSSAWIQRARMVTTTGPRSGRRRAILTVPSPMMTRRSGCSPTTPSDMSPA